MAVLGLRLAGEADVEGPSRRPMRQSRAPTCVESNRRMSLHP